MRLPAWLDRERRIRSLTVLLDAATAGHRDALRLYGRKCSEYEQLAAKLVTRETEITNLRAQGLADRERYAQRLMEATSSRIVGDPRPRPAVFAPTDLQAALYRLEEANERLRNEIAVVHVENCELRERLAKYEGATP